MLAKKMLLTIYEFDHHTNNRLLDLALNVTPEQWDKPADEGQRSLHETLFHLLTVLDEWLTLCRDGKSVWDERKFEDYPDVASLRVLSDTTYEKYLPYINALTEDVLNTEVFAVQPHGIEAALPVWHMLTHAFFHNGQHRSECAVMLTRYGYSPSYIDFYGYGL